MSDKATLCKWNLADEFLKRIEANICAISLFPETKTLVFRSNPLNPNAMENIGIPILVKEEPEIFFDQSTQQTPGYSSTIKIRSPF